MKRFLTICFLLCCYTFLSVAQSVKVGPFQAGHCQGIAVDQKRGLIYYSFTTMLVKTDLEGHVLGSVTGLLGHLGCLTFNDADGRIYGSLEYKNDEIGKGILKREGAGQTFENAWYIAIFDGDKITREQMDYTEEGVMTAVYLPTVVADYEATTADGHAQRYGCSGIDGVSFGPAFGQTEGKQYLTCAYGIRGDTLRNDNDYQVLLQYDTEQWRCRYEQPLGQNHLHHAGPTSPEGKYFVYTGNTNWGVQNLTYQADTHHWFLFVYPGSKHHFTNHSLYIVDGSIAPRREVLKGMQPKEHGQVLTLLPEGIADAEHGIYGWDCPYGSTGSAALQDGRFYLIRSYRDAQGEWAELLPHRWTGAIPNPFTLEIH